MMVMMRNILSRDICHYYSLIILLNWKNLSLHNIPMSCLDEDKDADYQNIDPLCEEQHNQIIYLYDKRNLAKET